MIHTEPPGARCAHPAPGPGDERNAIASTRSFVLHLLVPLAVERARS